MLHPWDVFKRYLDNKIRRITHFIQKQTRTEKHSPPSRRSPSMSAIGPERSLQRAKLCSLAFPLLAQSGPQLPGEPTSVDDLRADVVHRKTLGSLKYSYQSTLMMMRKFSSSSSPVRHPKSSTNSGLEVAADRTKMRTLRPDAQDETREATPENHREGTTRSAFNPLTRSKKDLSLDWYLARGADSWPCR